MMNNNSRPLISIIVPTYNLQDYVSETIKSILAQEDYSNFEVLIVDDHSVDNTLDIINSYAEQDSRIRVFTNNRKKGVAGARNTALANAKGEWIGFLDGDDLWDPRTLATQVAVLDEYPDVRLITADLYRVDEDNVTARQSEVDPVWNKYFHEANQAGKLLRLDNPIESFLQDEVLMRTGVCLIKHDLVKEVGFCDESLEAGVDLSWFLKLARAVDYIIYIPKPLMTYQYRYGSLTRRGLPFGVYGVIAFKKLLRLEEFKPHKRSIKKHISEWELEKAYFYRKNRQNVKALKAAAGGIIYDAKNIKHWKNLVAALLFF